jgi:hypothetical protein
MRFLEFLAEGRKKEKKIVFQETDGRTPYPNDTMTSLNKEINKNCKDLEKVWNNAVEVVNHSFNELDIPIPRANLPARWSQYKELIAYAVKNLYDARGLNGGWTTSI